MRIETIGEDLRQLRLGAGLTQGRLAAAARTDQARISAYENGHHIPTLPKLAAILEALGHRLEIIPAAADG